MNGPPPNRRAGDLRLDALQRRVDEADDLAAEHATRLDLAEQQGSLVAQQIAALDLKIDARFREIEERMPAIIAATIEHMGSDPKRWAKWIKAFREGFGLVSRDATGGFVHKMLRLSFIEVVKFVFLLALAYNVLGWKGLLSLVMFKGPAP